MTGISYWDECNSHTIKIFGDVAKVRKNIHDLEHGKSKNSDAALVLWDNLEELLSTAKAIAKTLEKRDFVPYPEPHWFRNRETGMAVQMDLTDWESQVALFLSPEVGPSLNAPRDERLAEKSEPPVGAEVGPVERNPSGVEMLAEQCALSPSPEEIAGISFWEGWQRIGSLEEEEGHDDVVQVPGIAFRERDQDRSNVAALIATLDDDMHMGEKKAEWACGA